MVTQLLYGFVIWDDDEYYIDKMNYKGQKFDSQVSIWWEVIHNQNELPAYNVCYDKNAGFIFYRKKSDADEQKKAKFRENFIWRIVFDQTRRGA